MTAGHAPPDTGCNQKSGLGRFIVKVVDDLSGANGPRKIIGSK